VKRQVKIANGAFKEATSCTKEYNIVNNTFQAQLDQAKKRTQAMAVELGEKLAPVMRLIHSSTYYLLRLLKMLVDFFRENYAAIVSVTAGWVAYKIAVNAATVAQKAHHAMSVVVNVAYRALYATVFLLQSVYYLLTMRIKAAKESWVLFSRALNMSPIGLLIGAITAVVAGLVMWATRANDAADEQAKLNKEIAKAKSEAEGEIRIIQALIQNINSENVASAEKAKMVNELKRRTNGLNIELDKSNKLTSESIKLLNNYCAALRAKAVAEAYEGRVKENAVTVADLEAELAGLKAERDRLKREAKRIGAQDSPHPGTVNIESLNNSRKILALDRDIQSLEAKIAKAKAEGRKLDQQLQNAQREAATTGGYEVDSSYDNTYTPSPIITSGGSGSGSGGGGTNNTKVEETYLQKRQKQYDQQVREEQLAYLKLEKNFDEYTKARRKLEDEFYNDVTTNEQVELADRQKLQIEYYEIIKQRQELENNESLEKENQYYEELVTLAKQSYVDGRTNYEVYQKELALLELEHLKRTEEIQKKISEKYTAGTEERAEADKAYEEAHKAYLDRLVQDQKDMQDKQKELEEKKKKEQEKAQEEWDRMRQEYFGDNIYERALKYQKDLDLLKQIYEKEMYMAEHDADEKLRIEEAFQKAKEALRKKYQLDEEEDNRNFLEKWNDEMQEWLKSDWGQAMQKGMEAMNSAMSSVMQQMTTLIQAEAQIQEAAVTKRYDAEIAKAEGNNYKVKQLEKKREQEIAKIKNEANKKQFAMQVMQAVAQTAQNALAAYGSAAAIPVIGYILAPIAAAAAIAAGAIQIAAIKKQQQESEAQGYAVGGFTPEGNENEPAGIVHKGEWVASQRLLRSPVARPMIEALDFAQRTNTIGSLRQADVSRSIAPAIFASSIPQSSPIVIQSTTPQEEIIRNSVAMREYTSVIRELKERLSEPFVTVNTVTGDSGIKQAQDEYNKLMRNKTPKSRR